MIKTFGLTHIALAVKSARRASRFYRDVFGAVEVYRGKGFVQIQTPGSRDAIVFEERDPKKIGRSGGIAHFGFRLQRETDATAAARAVIRAGGTVTSQGEFCPGEPFVFARDPDGYAIEIWFEIPTPADPPAVTATAGSRRSSSGSRRAGRPPAGSKSNRRASPIDRRD
jgi:catechol 2,3-dioxygenase-like lactoylglutathione lyase family enzyme